MKVFILYQEMSYEPSPVFGVFSSLELASKKLEISLENGELDKTQVYAVREFDLDTLKEQDEPVLIRPVNMMGRYAKKITQL